MWFKVFISFVEPIISNSLLWSSFHWFEKYDYKQGSTDQNLGPNIFKNSRTGQEQNQTNSENLVHIPNLVVRRSLVTKGVQIRLHHSYLSHVSSKHKLQFCSVSSLHWAILLSKLSRLMYWEWKSARLGVFLRARKLIECLNLLFGTFQNVQKFWLGISNLKNRLITRLQFS